ncbi:MAG: chromosome segregation ATPase [Pseudomonadales bacterium]|jgi:chromosome segregation ATPase
MLAAKRLEMMIEIEDKLKAEYQAQIDIREAEIKKLSNENADQKATIAKQLEQIQTLSTSALSSKKLEQQNRELHQRSENLKEEVATHKARTKALQKDLAEERAEITMLKRFDTAKIKKNLDASKKKLAEKTAAAEVLQKKYTKYKAENSEFKNTVKELEKKLEAFEEDTASEEKTD